MFSLFGIYIVSQFAYEISILKLIQYLLNLIQLRNVDCIVIGHKHRKPNVENMIENITNATFKSYLYHRHYLCSNSKCYHSSNVESKNCFYF